MSAEQTPVTAFGSDAQATSGAARRYLGKQTRRRALISLTPLIDVVFILLVFFMLASSFLEWRSIELSAPGGPAGTGMVGSLLVDVTRDGVRVSGEPLGAEALVPRVRSVLAGREGSAVVVRVAPGVSAQAAVDVLDRLGTVGISDLVLVERGR